MTTALASLLVLLVAPALDDKKEGKKTVSYPRAELLVEAEDLAKLKKEAVKEVRILDVRPKEQYAAGHIPGAVWLDVKEWSEFPPPSSKQLSNLAIHPECPVVIYDDGSAREAARAWWLLKYAGHEDARLLNGGWTAWQAAKGEISKDEPKISVTPAAAGAIGKRVADKDFVQEAVKKKSFQIVDARSEGEFCGDEKHAKRGGSIPGAIHLEWSDTLDSKTKRFKSADELTKLFKEAGIDPEKPTITYCQSGGRASVMAFALELMGAKDVRNYYKSWAEWGNDPETPIETSKPKK